ncbi:MAG: hypothetical protein DLM61_09970 [Pseudonocardiales bacterium]|nr:MAG: hypothetical protein DLM61_09970 [Pseudonocardiales bacterium]
MTPPAQAAVNAYYADFNADTASSRAPDHADLSWVAKYETGKARTQTQQAYAFMKAHGRAFRGTPPNPSVKVRSVLSDKAVILTSCLLVDKSNPWVQYATATGNAIPVAKRNPPPPYLLTIFMRTGSSGDWQLYDVLQSADKTCRG